LSKRNTVPAFILSAFALTLSLFSVVITAQIPAPTNYAKPKSVGLLDGMNLEFAPQKGPEVVAGAPLKGVDVKLGKNPGGSPAARTTTDSKGKFNLGVVPAGSYILTLDLPEEPKATGDSSSAKEKGPSAVNVKLARIGIDGAVGGPINRGWDPKSKKPFDQAPQSTAKTTDQEKIILESDGKTPLTGIVETAIVKPKSNITNNGVAAPSPTPR
jgi:hypothetical protein